MVGSLGFFVGCRGVVDVDDAGIRRHLSLVANFPLLKAFHVGYRW